MDYLTLLKELGYSSTVIGLAEGRFEIAEFTFDVPFVAGYGFPPALLPLWSNAEWPGYVGAIKHWFGHQVESYVFYFVETGSYVEVAKNVEQLKAWLTYHFFCIDPDFIHEAGRFAESIDFCDAGDVEAIFAPIANVSDLATLPLFSADVPAVLLNPLNEAAPAWVRSPVSVTEIIGKIEAGFLEEAWLLLNSSSLGATEMLDLLSRLAVASDGGPEKFRDLIDCWKEANLLYGDGSA